jgi:DNA-directed RNA polymerase specialized sigma24 family protein
MAESRSPVADGSEAGTLLDPYLKGQRGAQLRSQLITLHPDASATEIDEAIQIACDRFLTKADGITEHGQVYAWLRITAHRELLREDDRRKRLIVVDPAKTLAAVPADELKAVLCPRSPVARR